jgi:hypothetical protein
MHTEMNTSFSLPPTRRTNQACDACKLRKVKCNGQEKCQQCSHLNLRCVYSAPKPRTKTLKRGKLIAQYKETTNGRAETSESSPAQLSPSLINHDASFFTSFLDDYDVSVYPVNPIMTVDDVLASIREMDQSAEAKTFVYAYTAITIALTNKSPDNSTDSQSQVRYWLEELTKAKAAIAFDEKMSVRRVMISQFTHISLMCLANMDMSFYYVRESITMIQMLRIGHPEVMEKLNSSERARRQRLYWEVFIHERYLAISNYRPVVLPPLHDLPEFDPSIPPGVHEGFLQIIRLFRLIDDGFLANWFGTTTVTREWIDSKHKEIDEEPVGNEAHVGVTPLTDMQQADLIVTKHWLRMLVWQMAMSKCLLSSVSSKESLSLSFPVRLSIQLRALMTRFSRQAIEIHGSGIQQKLFELTDTIANVIITVPATTVQETAGRVDDFTFLIGFLFSLPSFDPVQKEILQNKLEQLQSLFPYSASEAGASPAASDVAYTPGSRPLHHDLPSPPSRVVWHEVAKKLSMAHPQENPRSDSTLLIEGV